MLIERTIQVEGALIVVAFTLFFWQDERNIARKTEGKYWGCAWMQWFEAIYF